MEFKVGDKVEYELSGNGDPRWNLNFERLGAGDYGKGVISSVNNESIVTRGEYPGGGQWIWPNVENKDYDPDQWDRPGYLKKLEDRRERVMPVNIFEDIVNIPQQKRKEKIMVTKNSAGGIKAVSNAIVIGRLGAALNSLSSATESPIDVEFLHEINDAVYKLNDVLYRLAEQTTDESKIIMLLGEENKVKNHKERT